VRDALCLDTPMRDVEAAVAYHGYIQIDPINVCGRMHDLILRNRVAKYAEGDLMRILHGDDQPLPAATRTLFEHHHPETDILVAFPLEAWPHLLAAMRRRSRTQGAWSGKLTARERTLAQIILKELSTRGPLSSDQIADSRRGRTVWGSASLAKSTLQKMFFHGLVMIAGRRSHRRLYDLPERILPPATLTESVPSPEDTLRWLTLLKLRQRRLVILTRDEQRAVSDQIQSLQIRAPSFDAKSLTLYCLRTDAARLAAIAETPASEPREPQLIAPLDPLIYDRRLTSAIWNFDYTWEVYTPPLKRIRGYYALPILADLEIVGHLDMKRDRVHRHLVMVSKRIRRGYSLALALSDFSQWLGTTKIIRPTSKVTHSSPTTENQEPLAPPRKVRTADLKPNVSVTIVPRIFQ
jgi:uncharacterized protein YcaQ